MVFNYFIGHAATTVGLGTLFLIMGVMHPMRRAIAASSGAPVPAIAGMTIEG